MEMLKNNVAFLAEPNNGIYSTLKVIMTNYTLQEDVIKSMAEEIFIKRAWSITSEEDIEKLIQRIIIEHTEKVLQKGSESGKYGKRAWDCN